jgi:hypothetical protein
LFRKEGCFLDEAAAGGAATRQERPASNALRNVTASGTFETTQQLKESIQRDVVRRNQMAQRIVGEERGAIAKSSGGVIEVVEIVACEAPPLIPSDGVERSTRRGCLALGLRKVSTHFPKFRWPFDKTALALFSFFDRCGAVA